MGEDGALLKVLLISFTSLTFVYLLLPRLHNKNIKLLAIFPVIYIFWKLPWLFSSIIIRTNLMFILTWITNFKLALFCFDSGPLVAFKHNFVLFIVFAFLPLHPKSNPSDAKRDRPRGTRSGLTMSKLLIYVSLYFIFIKFFLMKYSLNDLNPMALTIIFTLHLYMSLDVTLTGIGVLFRHGLGVELEPYFDEPYLSSSVAEFWGRRWNLIVTNTLRPSVYIPVRDTCSRVMSKTTAKAVSVFAVFLVSGVVHEVLLCSIVDGPPTGEWMAFFMVHGIIVVVEDRLHWWMENRGYKVPKVVSVPLTLTVMYVTGVWLFVFPLTRHDLDAKLENELLVFKAWWTSIISF